MLILSTLGCGAKTGLPVPEGDRGVDASADANLDATLDGELDATLDAALDALPPPDGDIPICRRPAPVDLLLVIDDSGSMFEEQLQLAEQLPRLVADLASPPDENGDGRRDWRAIEDIHLGVVTTDVAVNRGQSLCGGTPGDGVFVNQATAAGCDPEYPRFLTFSAPTDSVSEVSEDFSCVARVGDDGCGVELPLEAMLKALLPSDTELGFLSGRPHGSGENSGFLRDDSLLAVVFLTDEDDCSFQESDFIVDWVPDRFELPPCTRPDDPLFPIDRYEEALRALRPEQPELLAVAVIAGVPERSVADPSNIDYDALLANPFMRNRIDRGSASGGLVPACEGRRGRAFPARRLVTLAQRFGDQATVGSICQESYTPIVGAIARLVGTRACEEFED